jgi:iron complex transport system ATP-binding protein
MGLIELRGVTVERGGRTLIADVDMTLAPGRMTVLIGPNGAGKSTALKVASGVWPATKGAAALDGQDIARMKPRELAERRALVAQGASLGFPFTVGEVVMLGATVPGFGLDSSPEIATGALASVGLTGFEARNYLELSGGERQRVHIARALCQLRAARRHGSTGQVMLLDEPTASLDPAQQTMVMALCRSLASAGLTVVLVLHDLNLAAAWADTLVVLAKGRVRAIGSPSDVLTDDLLRSVYDWRARVNTPPRDGEVFVLPHHARDMSFEPSGAGRVPHAE